MASTGTALFPATDQYPNTNVYPGQGTLPILLVQYAVDDLSELSPTWLDASEYVRSFTISRGRDRELSDVDAGTAQIVLDNRARTFDPLHNADIRPRNRWRIREQFTGETQAMFTGYAESYDQLWPDGSGIKDAVAVANLVDEFKLLAQRRLPTMDPPRDSYEEVVMFDNPQGYWRGQPVPAVISGIIWVPTVGSTNMGHVGGAGTTVYVTSPILGDATVNQPATAPGVGLARRTDTAWTTMSGDTINDYDGLSEGGPGDAGALSAMTFETWFRSDEAAPGAGRNIARGPLSSAANTWSMTHNTTGTVSATARNSGGTTYTATSSAVLSANIWYHLAMVVTGSDVQVYVNGVLSGSSGSFTGSFGAIDANEYMQVGTSTAVGGNRSYDEIAFYRTNLSSDRVLAHYEAGLRGYPSQDPGVRLEAILNDISSRAPRSIRTGTREMQPSFQAGQPALSEMRKAQAAENVDAVLFVARDGTITFLDDGHRSVSPWDTVQATFDDDGTDLPYHGLDVDYSDSFLANVVNTTGAGLTTYSVSDATSIAAYGQTEPLTLTDLPITTESDQEDIADGILAKIKDPMYRFVSMDLTCADPDLIEAVFQRDIGDRIRIFRTAPGGGSRIDQQVFIQRIEIQGDPSRIFRVRWAVTPL